MLQIVWEFEAKAGRQAEFERTYASDGPWAQLFGRSPGYQGTTLARDTANPRRYLVIDRWVDEASFAAFKAAHGAEYETHDRDCEALTAVERSLGRFEVCPS